MTMPDERSRAITTTREFLYALLDPKVSPGVPRYVRQAAHRCLRHYPFTYNINEAAKAVPGTFAEQAVETRPYEFFIEKKKKRDKKPKKK